MKLPRISPKAGAGLVALALIAWGLGLIYAPAAPLVVGSLIWLDLATSKPPRRK